VGWQFSGELLRYDAQRKEFLPFLGGLSADHLDFTRDGQWVTYVAYPEGTLWRARVDGGEQLQLTFPPLRVYMPRWSPDGRRIAFEGREPGKSVKAYAISVDGGNPKALLQEPYSQSVPQWMPGGDSILYGRSTDTETPSDVAAYQVDLQSGQASKIPGTDGLWGPQLSPAGDHLIGAVGPDGNRKLVVVNVRTGARTQLSQRRIDYPVWSADSRYVYFNNLLTTPAMHEPAIFRVRVADGREEKVTDVKFEVTGIWGTWSGLAPDGSPLVLRARERKDIYALSLALP